MQEISKGMAKGAAWMVLARIIDRSLGLVSTVVLARLLVPEDFGLVALAMAILAGLELLGAFSFDLALIQHPKAERKHYDTVWTINLFFSLCLAAGMLLLAHPAAAYFEQPKLTAVMQLLAIGVVASGLANVGVVAFRKELRFDREFVLLLMKRLVVFTTTMSLAFYWRDYRALVVGTIAGMIFSTINTYWMHPYRPRLSLAARSEIFAFSGWLFINNILGYLYMRAADFVLGKAAGPGGLGQYSVAYEIAHLPSTELIAPINRAVFPGYSKMASDIRLLRQGYLNVIAMMSLLALPASVGLGAVSEPLVGAFLGPKWTGVVPLVPILALHGALVALTGCGHYAFLALGRARLVTVLLGVRAVIALPLLAYAAMQEGIQGAAWALLTTAIVMLPVNYVLLAKTLRVRVRNLLEALWRPIVGVVVMYEVLNRVGTAVHLGDSAADQISRLLILVPLGAVTYALVVLVLWLLLKRPEGAESFLGRQLFRRLKFL